MGGFWTYYKVVLKETGGAFLLRSTAQSRARIFGIQVDERGNTMLSEGGAPRVQAFDRAGIQEITPLVMSGGLLVSAPQAGRTRRE